jgi:hypothetical protein
VVLVSTLVFLEQLTILPVVAIAVAFVLILTRWGAVFATLIAIGLAAWWSAGGSSDAAAVLWHTYSPVAGAAPVPAASASAVEQAKRLEGALGPALAIGAMLVVAAVLRSLARRGADRGD